ncbi:hypothetical protein [Yersinia enterocolitica]|uniref:hypothetical protein n=1 Tax=Yersinia enterocolitica TaxID=630 RepID=UPI001C8D964F|nr:hypothetical protein [Yersinia enterocolitica]MBX9477407.1 hypothetical protein [Yersinia enterocolitica]HEI6819336.1 hypothetical protein [Yersinia enterocolitica]
MEKLKLPRQGYALVRCKDCAVVTVFKTPPKQGKALINFSEGQVSLTMLRNDHYVSTVPGFLELISELGYTVIKN